MSALSVLQAAREVPERLALTDGAEATTFEALAERVRERMRELAPLARTPGPALVALGASEPRAAIELILALLELEVPFFPMHQRATPVERAALLGTLPFAWRVEVEADARLRLSEQGGRLGVEAAAVFGRTPVLAALATSGSTGAPRVALLGRAAFVAAAAASAAHLGWQPDDRWLLCLPLAHIGGLSVVTRCLIARKAVVLPSGGTGTSSERLANSIDAGRPTLISMVPAQLDGLLELAGFELPRSVRAILTGGAAASPRLLQRCAVRAWPVLTSYGLTEACSQVATQPPGETARAEAGVGVPLPGVGVQVEGGLIRVSGPTLASAYLSGEHVEPIDGARGFLTRDLGHLDAAGRLHVLGRADDVIISGGENVAPWEVEAVLSDCPGVLEACAFGVDDPRWGQVVAAGLRTRHGDPSALVREVAGTVRERLAPFKRPRYYVCTTELVYGKNGKLDRAGSVQLLRGRLDTDPASYRAPSA